MGKTATFVDKNVDLKRLAKRVYSYLNENKFEVAYSKDESEPATWFFIQARKVDKLRTITGMRRSTDITIKGKPDHFDVNISTGEWGKNLMSSAPLLLGAGLLKDNDYAVIASVAAAGVSSVIKWFTARNFEVNLKKFIVDQIKFLENSYSKEIPPNPEKKLKKDSMEYQCDYVGGYPNWKEHLLGGRLILELYENGKNKIIFSSPTSKSKKIILPAEGIKEANIISQKKGFSEDDLMIQLNCKNKSGEIVHPVFNISDDIIRNVVSGISELVSDDKIPNMMGETITSDTKKCRNCNLDISTKFKFCTSCGFKQ